MAYVSYDSDFRPPSDRTRSPSIRARVAWARLAVVATSILAWAGIIAAARAIF